MNVLDKLALPAALTNYLDKLNPRDRLAVIVLAVFVVVSLAGLAALKLHRAADKAEQLAQQEKELLVWLQASAPVLSTGAANSQSVLDAVSATAGGMGINMQRFEPDGDSVRVWLESAEFAKVANWLNALNQQGVRAQEVHFEQGGKGLSVRLVFGK